MVFTHQMKSKLAGAKGAVQQVSLKHLDLRRARREHAHMCRRQVDADDPARGSDLIEQPVQSLTRPASRIQYSHPRAQAQTPDQPAKFGLRESIE